MPPERQHLTAQTPKRRQYRQAQQSTMSDSNSTNMVTSEPHPTAVKMKFHGCMRLCFACKLSVRKLASAARSPLLYNPPQLILLLVKSAAACCCACAAAAVAQVQQQAAPPAAGLCRRHASAPAACARLLVAIAWLIRDSAGGVLARGGKAAGVFRPQKSADAALPGPSAGAGRHQRRWLLRCFSPQNNLGLPAAQL